MKKKNGFFQIIKYILYFVLLFVVSGAFIDCIKDCNEYKDIYKDAVVVKGVITGHDEYTDSEGDTDYIDYVSYESNGKVYRNVKYQTTSVESKRLPLGEEVELSLNPKNRGQLMKNVASAAATAFLGISTFLVFFLGTSSLLSRCISESLESVHDRDAVIKDVKYTFAAKVFRPSLLATSIFFMVMPSVYPMLFSDVFYFFGIVFAVWWLLLIVRVYRRAQKLAADDFSISKEVVVDTEIDSDSEGGTSYYLVIRGKNGNWRKSVSKKEYDRTRLCQTIYSVYLGNEKKPVITYNKF